LKTVYKLLKQKFLFLLFLSDYSKNFKFFIVFFVFLNIFFFSCKKEPNEVGLNFKQNLVSSFKVDTLTIGVETIFIDSTRSDENSLQLLGSYFDPIFGYTEASFMTQFFLSKTNVNFGTNPIIDSILLCLDYQYYYGDTSLSHSVFVYELEKDIFYDSIYYSNLNPDIYTPNKICIGFKNFIPQPNDTALIIKLENSFGEKILNLEQSSFIDNKEFIKRIKGIYVKVLPNYDFASIISFNLLSKRSKVILFYHNQEDVTVKSFTLVFSEECARINIFNHNYQQSLLGPNLNNDTLLFLKGLSGSNVRIYFPTIKELKKYMPFAVVRADLILPIWEDDYSTTYKPPSRLFLMKKVNNTYNFLPDYNVSSSFFGGNMIEGLKEYRFNISRYIQDLINKPYTDEYLELMIYENKISPHRVVLYNGNLKKIRLILLCVK